MVVKKPIIIDSKYFDSSDLPAPALFALIKIANILECSVDYFIDGEYTYKISKDKEKTLDEKILDKLKYCDMDKKTRILKMIDLL